MATGKVRMLYRYVAFSPQTLAAAEAAECAGEQGHFWEYHDEIYRNQMRLAYSREDFRRLARTVQLDERAFDACLSAGRAAARVQADLDAGRAKGVQRTPTVFVNDRKVEGALTFAEFQKRIEEALAR